MQPASQSRQLFIRPGFDPFAASVYLFDIDGTLLNTRDGVHWNAFRAALREVFGIESLLDDIPVHGNTDIGILRAVVTKKGLPASEFERELPRLLAIMRSEVEGNCKAMQCELCPGVGELLAHLERRGRHLGVVSGNLASIGWKKVESAGLRKFFSFGSFSDGAELRVDIFRKAIGEANRLLATAQADSTGHRPLATDHCIFVADTPADVAAAGAVAAPIIAVATGIYDFAELLASSPDACVLSCDGLLSRAPFS